MVDLEPETGNRPVCKPQKKLLKQKGEEEPDSVYPRGQDLLRRRIRVAVASIASAFSGSKDVTSSTVKDAQHKSLPS